MALKGQAMLVYGEIRARREMMEAYLADRGQSNGALIVPSRNGVEGRIAEHVGERAVGDSDHDVTRWRIVCL